MKKRDNLINYEFEQGHTVKHAFQNICLQLGYDVIDDEKVENWIGEMIVGKAGCQADSVFKRGCTVEVEWDNDRAFERHSDLLSNIVRKPIRREKATSILCDFKGFECLARYGFDSLVDARQFNGLTVFDIYHDNQERYTFFLLK